MNNEQITSKTIYIKNMVCDRCKTAVTSQLNKLNIEYQNVELGEVLLQKPVRKEILEAFKTEIANLGFEVIDDKRSKSIEKIKALVIAAIYQASGKNKVNFSSYLAETLGKEYSSLSSLFSQVEGTTIEQFIIRQKIERTKELLVYDELTLSQIADQLNYSSVQHLSNQFKKVTGLTPSYFKNARYSTRKSLDKV